jgi:hypothetical protein
MNQITLVHWNQAEARERIARLKKLGFDATWFGGPAPDGQLARTRANPPNAYLIDLSRLPSHGRAVAVTLREQKATRGIPLVFVDGDPEKVARIRELLPDAAYTDWKRLGDALWQAIRNPPANPVVWKSPSGAYSGTPLAKKLGLKPGTTLLILGASTGFEKQLGPHAAEVTIRKRAFGKANLIILFALGEKELLTRLPAALRCLSDGGSVWVAWPKKASGVPSDLSDGVVRKTLLAAGLVDYKVCAIDTTWSGLKFARRKQ